jgi:hypothetical protein
MTTPFSAAVLSRDDVHCESCVKKTSTSGWDCTQERYSSKEICEEEEEEEEEEEGGGIDGVSMAEKREGGGGE